MKILATYCVSNMIHDLNFETKNMYEFYVPDYLLKHLLRYLLDLGETSDKLMLYGSNLLRFFLHLHKLYWGPSELNSQHKEGITI